MRELSLQRGAVGLADCLQKSKCIVKGALPHGLPGKSCQKRRKLRWYHDVFEGIGPLASRKGAMQCSALGVEAACAHRFT